MKLPSLDKDTVQATLEGLVNGEVCLDCDGRGKWYAEFPRNPKDCLRCHGTGRTAPDLRTVDALVCRELGYNAWFKDEQVYPFPDWVCGPNPDTVASNFRQPVIEHYTTSWADGGPLLEEADVSFTIDKTWLNSEDGYIYFIELTDRRGDDKNYSVEIKHPSELVARVYAFLIWKVKTGVKSCQS